MSCDETSYQLVTSPKPAVYLGVVLFQGGYFFV
jgi:hypothetical protein